MFKHVDTTRPYPATEMTTAKWKQVPCFWVDISDLIATQEGVNFQPLIVIDRAMRYTSHSGDIHPHVVSWRGNLYLEDGHHRTVGRLFDGKKTVFARVLTIVDHGE
jgi:hypothetical protein